MLNWPRNNASSSGLLRELCDSLLNYDDNYQHQTGLRRERLPILMTTTKTHRSLWIAIRTALSLISTTTLNWPRNASSSGLLRGLCDHHLNDDDNLALPTLHWVASISVTDLYDDDHSSPGLLLKPHYYAHMNLFCMHSFFYRSLILIHVFTDTVPSICAHSLPCIDTSRFFVNFTLYFVHQATLRYVCFVEALLCNHSSVHRYPYPPSVPTISLVLIHSDFLVTFICADCSLSHGRQKNNWVRHFLNVVHQATFRYVSFPEALLYAHSCVHRYPALRLRPRSPLYWYIEIFCYFHFKSRSPSYSSVCTFRRGITL
jgi:hypothetical protein